MKKLLCIFLMLWLPLFSAAAAAMSMQMELTQSEAAPTLAQAEAMPCHDAAANTDTGSEQPCCDDHETSHDCFACGVCAFSHASTYPSASISPAFLHPVSAAPGYLDRVFFSQLYPPALKPPISA